MPNRSSDSSGVVFLDREQALADVGRAITALVARRAGVREVWLFGSLARGNATARSDADLLVVVDRDERRPMDRIPEFLLLLEGLGRPADVLVPPSGRRARVRRCAARWSRAGSTSTRCPEALSRGYGLVQTTRPVVSI
jgi:predicted nucleotidyltransferase